MIDKKKLRINGQLLTQKLFLELNGWDQEAAVFTLTDEDKKLEDGTVLPSLSRLYIEMEDVHEYEFAKSVFGSWKHWCRIAESPRLKSYVEEWRQELETKLRSRNLKRIEEQASEGDHRAVKYMADMAWKAPEPKKRGRPSKEEIAGKLKQDTYDLKGLEDDWNRITQ